MTDYKGGITSPARHVFRVTPNDDNPLPVAPKAIRAIGAGTIVFRAVDSGADVTHPVFDGERIDAVITHVRATGTNVDLIGYA